VIPDEKVLAALREFGLGTVLQRVGGLDAERDWQAELSLEEQQLVTLARLTLAGPCFAFLDRPGSTLGPVQRQRALQRLAADSISFIIFEEAAETVGEYDTVLELGAGGAWSSKPVGPELQPGRNT
jgi:putative ATP-binding cassette transporter